MNNITAVGNVARDTELRHVNNNLSIASFSLGVSRNRKDANGEYPTDWFKCEIFGKQAENAAKYIKKGILVAVTGRVEIDNWTKQDGTKGTTVKIACNDFKLLSKPKADDGEAPRQAANKPPAQAKPADERYFDNSGDEIPF